MSGKLFVAGSVMGGVLAVLLQGPLRDIQQYLTSAADTPEGGAPPVLAEMVLMAVRCSDASTQLGIFSNVLGEGNFVLTHHLSDGSTEVKNVDGSLITERIIEEGVSSSDLYLGNNVVVNEICYTIVGYGNAHTRDYIATNRQSTFAMIKPDAMPRVGAILTVIGEHFSIAEMRLLRLTKKEAELFYEEHKERTFFGELVSYVTRSPVLAMRLVGPNAVPRWRKLLGPTNSEEARRSSPTSIRAKFGQDKQENAAHGSDSAASALRELALFFPDKLLETNRVSLRTDGGILEETSCFILPHIIRSGSFGKLLTSFTEDHRCQVAGLELVRFSHLDALRHATGHMLPLHKPETKEKVEALLAGPAIFVTLKESPLESKEQFKRRFKDIIGPIDPPKARKSAVESLRAAFGINRAHNAVLCPHYDWSH